jgi:NAD(P)-dependent dehydrogenase (short-subunit alcohol dehydrogenase family)
MTAIFDLFSLEGKRAVVIGGSGALGSEFCRGLAAAGTSVAVLGRSEKAIALARELTGSGATAIGIPVDATDRGQLERAEKEIAATWGGIDILINAPGVNSSTPFFEITEEEWHRIIDTNLTSTFLACQVFGQTMREGGSIINISSASSGPPLSRVFSYGISKAGINNLTQYLARELAPLGIRVNAIAPGFFPAEQNRKILSTERVEAILRHTPMARLGMPDELIGTVIWLASAAASGFVTGAIIRVDGGFSAMTI